MQDLKLAVLIDADNISPKYVKVIWMKLRPLAWRPANVFTAIGLMPA